MRIRRMWKSIQRKKIIERKKERKIRHVHWLNPSGVPRQRKSKKSIKLNDN